MEATAERLPDSPTAVYVYDEHATAPAVWLDFDAPATRDGRAAIARDHQAIATALLQARIPHISTYNRVGRRHLIIPVAGGIGHTDLAGLLRPLAAVVDTLDVSPMLNPATGCVRPPGSPHKKGGFQVLDGDPDLIASTIAAAVDADTVLAFLTDLLHSRQAQALPHHTRQPVLPAAGTVEDPRIEHLPRKAQRIAAEGPQASDGYRSDSEARMYVAGQAAHAGWTPDDYLALIAGQPWLHAQYTAGGNRLQLARYEITKALSSPRRKPTVQIWDTSHISLHGGGTQGGGAGVDANPDYPLTAPPADDIHLRLRRVRTGVIERSFSEGWDPLLLTLALGVLWFAHSRAEMRLRCGVRSLAICCGTSRTSAAAGLHRLAELGIIERMAQGCGEIADLWLIHDAPDQDPTRGDLYVLPPAFRSMADSHSLARIHEVLRRAHRIGEGGLSGREIARRAGLSPATVNDRLARLLDERLAQHGPTRGGHPTWLLGPVDVDELAQRNGGAADQAAQIEAYRAERAAWREWLATRREHRGHYEDPPDAWDPLLATPPPPAGTAPARAGPTPENTSEDVIALLERELGAVRI